jgi:hypothetical protein
MVDAHSIEGNSGGRAVVVAREYVVATDPDRAWEFLWDLERVVGCIPGCDDLIELEEHQRYEAALRRQIGPFRLRLTLDVKVVERRAPSFIALRIVGVDGRLRSQVSQSVVLTIKAGNTQGEVRVAVESTVRLDGVLGNLGAPLVSMHVGSSIDEFGKAMQTSLEQRAVTAAE